MTLIQLSPDVIIASFADYERQMIYTFETPQGVNYNVGLVFADALCVINLPPPSFLDEFCVLLSTKSQNKQVSAIVLQYVNGDIAVTLFQFLQVYPKATVVGTRRAIESLLEFNEQMTEFCILCADEETTLAGFEQISFVRTPLLRWPESLAVFVRGGDIFFTGMVFAQAGGESGYLQALDMASVADASGRSQGGPENPDASVAEENASNDTEAESVLQRLLQFRASIFSQRGPRLRLFLQETTASRIVVPLHGFCLPTAAAQRVYSSTAVRRTVLCVYESMYGTTERAVFTLCGQLERRGIGVLLYNTKYTNLSSIALAASYAAALVVASPALNGDAMPGVLRALSHLKQLNSLQGHPGAVLGAYGWDGGEVQKRLVSDLSEMGVTCTHLITWKFNFGDDVVQKLNTAANEIADQVVEAYQ